MSTPAARLKHARKLRGMNQIQLAEKAGVATGTVGNIESGKRGIKSSALALARALSVSPDWLATGEGEMVIPLAQEKLALGPPDLTRKYVPVPENPDPMTPEDERQLELQTLGKALKVLASAFAHTPESTRNTVATLTASAVRDPATLPDCLRAIEALAVYSTATVETAAISKVGT